MDALGSFETSPVLAIGVSGGADSLALTLLTDRWAKARGGHAIGLTVDHGLRDASAAEAEMVSSWLDAYAIDHRVLPWQPKDRPDSGIQARAREARRGLLTDWCRENGVLHLLLAHHRDDQLETVSMRAERASAGAGLAGMSGISETVDVRVLRPLLPISRRAIETMLVGVGQSWIDDPSNRDRRFERVRVRQALAVESEEVLAGCCREIEDAGHARARLDDAVAALVGRSVGLHPAGFARVDLDTLMAADGQTGIAALSRLIRTISGSGHVPRSASMVDIFRRLTGPGRFNGATLGGCRLVSEGGRLLVCREPAAIAGDVPAAPGEVVVWDRRFRVRMADCAPAGLRIGALGVEGWRRIRSAVPPDMAATVPHAARLGLPALKDEIGVQAVPHLTYRRPGPHVGKNWVEEIAPTAAETVTKARFFVASGRE